MVYSVPFCFVIIIIHESDLSEDNGKETVKWGEPKTGKGKIYSKYRYQQSLYIMELLLVKDGSVWN